MRASRCHSLLSAADERLLEEIHDLLVRCETKRRRHHKKQSPTKRSSNKCQGINMPPSPFCRVRCS